MPAGTAKDRPAGAGVRPLSLVEALVPIVALALLIVASVLLFGDAGLYGPNQIALVLAGMIATLVARRAGHSMAEMNRAAIDSVSSGIGAIFILFAVGALIGTWAISGTLVAMVYYGIKILSPHYFPLSAFLVCALVSTCLGSSWTTAGTIGIGLMGMAISMGTDPAITAGAIISGAYVGEMISPLSDTGNLAAGAGGVDLYAHLREAALPTAIAVALAVGIYWLLSSPIEPQLGDEIAAIEANFPMTPWLFLPLAVVAAMALLRASPFTTIMTGALVGVAVAVIVAPGRIAAFADPAGALARPIAVVKGVWLVLASGYVSRTGHPMLDTLTSRGGMDSMLETVWLIIAALAFGGVVEKAGVLSRLIEPVIAGVRSAAAMVAALVGAVIATNIVAADHYMALVLPARMFRQAVAKLGYAPVVLTRTVAAAATPTSALIPWNSCGAFMAAALGVSTLAYAPFAVFNIASPLAAILVAALNIRMPKATAVPDERSPG